MKQNYFLLIAITFFSSFSSIAQSNWDDFDNQGKVVYPFFNGTVFNESFSNPSTTGVNTSALCAQYGRHGSAQYDVILVQPSGLMKVGSVADYTAGTKKITLKVYSTNVGKTVQITLENNNSAAPTNYPTGRHSEYTAVTSVANAWETLTFNLINTPDTTVPDTSINQLVLLFDPNSFNSDTYLFDDLMGPTLIDPCAGIVKDSTFGDDYECQRNVTFDFANGTHVQTEMNPMSTGANTSNRCGKFTKYVPPTNDGAFGGTLQYPFTTAKYNEAHIDLYSPAGAYDFKIVLQDGSGVDLLDQSFTTSSTTDWATFTMDISSIPTTTSIEKFVFLLNSPTATEDSIFLDNFKFSFNPSVGIDEKNSFESLTLFPNPFSNQIT
ncbi:MAG: hypothetical protein ACPGVD_11900, partial [Flavobacteriales bacterium]